MNKALKNRIINSIELLPYGHDLYLHMARKRLGITYRGIYDSFHEAQQQAISQLANEYDVINQNKGEHLEQELPVLDKRVLDIDYPLLFWLSRLMQPSQRLLELGGSIGQGFYSFENFFSYPDGLQWVIAELPAAVEAGRKIANQKDETRLAFIDSNDMGEEDAADIFMTAGTLQYMDTSIADTVSQLQRLPKHVLVHNLPAHPTEDFWTLQYLEVCEVPYHISSQANLVSDMEKAGYRLVDRWKNPRRIEIPYHLEKTVEHYHGFYFTVNDPK